MQNIFETISEAEHGQVSWLEVLIEISALFGVQAALLTRGGTVLSHHNVRAPEAVVHNAAMPCDGALIGAEAEACLGPGALDALGAHSIMILPLGEGALSGVLVLGRGGDAPAFDPLDAAAISPLTTRIGAAMSGQDGVS